MFFMLESLYVQLATFFLFSQRIGFKFSQIDGHDEKCIRKTWSDGTKTK